MEEYTVRFLNAFSPLLSRVPAPYYIGALLGIINSCLFYLGFGRGFRRFVPYLAVGAAGALLGVTIGRQLPDTGPLIGDVNVIAACASCWAVLFVARSLRL